MANNYMMCLLTMLLRRTAMKRRVRWRAAREGKTETGQK